VRVEGVVVVDAPCAGRVGGFSSWGACLVAAREIIGLNKWQNNFSEIFDTINAEIELMNEIMNTFRLGRIFIPNYVILLNELLHRPFLP
jgi:hypothetical protein